MRKCIFLDRDGVINVEKGDYTFEIEDFIIEEGVVQELKNLKSKGYLLIVITNQGGINKRIYTSKNVLECHKYFQEISDNVLDDIFHSPYHDDFTKSLSRKPNSLLLEKAIYKWNVDFSESWMVGDSSRDIVAGNKMNLNTLYVGKSINKEAKQSFESSAQALKYINSL